MDISNYWNAVLTQNREKLGTFFHSNSQIRWHNTNECFSVEEFIQANCDYPGSWCGEIEQVHTTSTHIITVVHVYSADKQQHFHVTSFFRILDNKIECLDEYWGNDGPAPLWRQDLKIGRKIKE